MLWCNLMFGSDFSEVKYRLVSVVRIVLSLSNTTRGTAKSRVLSRSDLPTSRVRLHLPLSFWIRCLLQVATSKIDVDVLSICHYAYGHVLASMKRVYQAGLGGNQHRQKL
jgi:hypothetical protein